MACMLFFGIQMACLMDLYFAWKCKSFHFSYCYEKIQPADSDDLSHTADFFFDKTTAVYMAEQVADFLAVTFTAILFIFQFKKELSGISSGNTKAAVQNKK